MAKVDWIQAEIEYITSVKISYDDIAKRHKVAKPTVVRRAKKEIWKAKRADFQAERVARARQLRMESKTEIDERHLRKLRMAQDIMNHEYGRLSTKLLTDGELTPQETRIVFDFIGPYIKAVMAERAILGLRTKLVRITNPEDIEAYLEAVGLKEPSPRKRYEELKEQHVDLQKLIEHEKRLRSYIEDYPF